MDQHTNTKKDHLSELAGILHGIDEQIPLKQEDIILLMHCLDGADRVEQFCDWLLLRMQGDKVLASRSEIIGAAARIYKSIPLD